MREAAPGGMGKVLGSPSTPRNSPASLRSASPSRPWLLHVLSAGSSDVPAAPPGRRKRSEENLRGIRNTEEEAGKEFPPDFCHKGLNFIKHDFFLQLKTALTQTGVKPALHHVLPLTLSSSFFFFFFVCPKQLKSSLSSSEPGKAGRRKRNEHGVGEKQTSF